MLSSEKPEPKGNVARTRSAPEIGGDVVIENKFSWKEGRGGVIWFFDISGKIKQ
ncbi:hypothetical protein K3H30_14950 [Aeromonas veronii]|uniref:hypothetical protein n=1 Tax=Aeromonas TaxID=642 RepID=UPI00163B6212|nr:hypothetical protein [Aeromonas veronii]MCF5718993.1 hypothetical protein [Aeromonas veronii]